MSIEEIRSLVAALEGVLVLEPGPGDGTPEIAWGDLFFYYAPDGRVPEREQPFATVVTKDYPGDDGSRLDEPGAFRLNIAAGREEFARRTGHMPGGLRDGDDPAARDALLPHPLYGAQAWLAVVEPGPRTDDAARDLLRSAHAAARGRWDRRRV